MTPRPPLRAVLFDLDGTLVTPELDFAAIRREAGIEGGHILEYMDSAPEERRREVKAILERHEAEAAARCRPVEGAHDVLALARRLGLKSAVITRNSRRSVEQVLRRHGFAVDAVVAREDAAPKPSPEPVFRACAALGVPSECALMVGDYVFDIESGRAAGARTALVRLPGRTYDGVRSDYALESLRDLLGLLEALAGSAKE